MHHLNDLIAKDGFRLRGRTMSRVDGFSDVVFGFALTLLVVSLEVPKTYNEFHELLLGFFPFAISFVFLMMVWWAHFRFFRRYGLHDFGTIMINAALMFLLLFYVYPLKFLFSIWTRSMFGELGADVFQSQAQVREMMLVYAVGFAAVYFAIAALFANAYRLRHDLHLNRLEEALTRSYLADFTAVAMVGVASAIAALLLPLPRVTLAGFVFFGIAIVKMAHKAYFKPRLHAIRESLTPDEKLPLPNNH